MDKLPGCGDDGGWTLVMKVNGTKNTFKNDSNYWSNKKVYKVQQGLKGLAEKSETKLASYWNTPFTKLCLGMKVEKKAGNNQNWIAIDHKASSLFDVIANFDKFTPTNIQMLKWKSLMAGSSLQDKCYREGFNILGGRHNKMYVRIGIVADQNDDCMTCNSCIGFGTSITGCYGWVKKRACGNIYACGKSRVNTAAFGYILVQ